MFSKNLSELRQTAGLNQQDLAKALDVTRATYIKLENGRRSPTLKELLRLSEVLQTSVDELISDQPPADIPAIDLANQKKAVDTPQDVVKLDKAKLEAVLLYVLTEIGSLPSFGETVLYKLMYFIDFDYYEKFSRSITGMNYTHNHYGPTPDVKTFKGLLKALEGQKRLTTASSSFHGKEQKKYLPEVDPDLSCLSAQEIKHIDEVLSRLGHKNAKELTDYSHKDTPWRATERGQVIDYQLSKYRTVPTSVVAEEDDL